MTGRGGPAAGRAGPVPGAATAHVFEVIRGQLAAWYGGGTRFLSDPIVQYRPWSVHFHAQAGRPSGGRVELVVKIPLWDAAPDLVTALAAGPQESTMAEYRMLQRIEEMVADAGDDRLTAVRPVAFLANINAVVTERLDSMPLRAVSARRRPAVGGAIGAWLRLFHDRIGGAVAGGFEVPDLKVGLSGSGRGLPGGRLGTAVASVLEDARSLAGRPVRIATTHGDFGPSNILVTPDGRVAVIDPNLVPGPVESDLAKLAVAVRTTRFRLLTGLRIGRHLHPLEAAVLTGYGEVTEEVYCLCRRTAALERWQEIEAGSGGLKLLALPMARRVLADETD